MPEPPAAELHERVLRAMTADLVVAPGSVAVDMTAIPEGTAVEAEHEAIESGETLVRYAVRGRPIATRLFRVDERSREVVLGRFELAKYEERYNGTRNLTALHERFLGQLTGTPCVLRAAPSGAGAHLWVPYYDWARDMANMNAANLETAVETLYEIVRRQTVWDAEDLPARVRMIADPDPERPLNWRHVIVGTTPARLAAGLEAINPGLTKAVFTRMSAWYAKRVVEPVPA